MAFCVALAAGLAPAPARAIDYADKAEIVDMLRRGSLTRLETWLAAYQNAFEGGRASDRLVDHAFSAFANSDPDLAAALDRWQDKRPESYAARMARGTYYWHLAWIARGEASGEDTGAERWRAMTGFLEPARADLDAALARKPRLSVAYARLITVDKWLGETGAAEFLMRKGLDLVPDSFVIREAYLDSLVPWWRADLTVGTALQNIAAFMKEIDYSAARHADLAPLRGYDDFVAGQILTRLGRYDDATARFRGALRHGGFWRYHFEQGLSHHRGGQYVFALQSYDRALALRPQAVDVLAARGWAYWAMDNQPRAIEEWGRALAFDALAPDTLSAQAIALEALGRTDEALAAYDKAAFYGAYDPLVRAGRGALRLHVAGDFAGAVDDLRAATELAPDKRSYWYDYASALAQVDDCNPDAAAAFANYIRLCKARRGCPDEQLIRAAGTVEQITAGACAP